MTDSLRPQEDDDRRFAPPDEALPIADADEDEVMEDVLDDIPLYPEIPLIDVDSALAAVSELDVMIAEQEEEERREQVRQWLAEREVAEREATIAAAQQREQARLTEVTRAPMSAPDLLMLTRGHVASVIPGLALIILGAWLTFAFATNTLPEPRILIGAAGGSLALTLLVVWLAGGRWSRGILLILLWSIGGALSLLVPIPILWGMFAALSFALLLTGLLGRPFNVRLIGAGGVVGVVAVLGIIQQMNLIPTVVFAWVPLPFVWIPIVALAGIILILPMVARLWR